MQLDINTPKGQLTLQQEQYVIENIRNKWGVDVVLTNKKREACYDGMIVKDGNAVAVIEIKCRDMSYDQMMKWGGTWLITHQKLVDCAQISKLSTVPLLGFLYLVPDNRILYWKITDDKGEFIFDFRVEETITQYCVNGGEALRKNAYLDVIHSKEL